MDASYKEELAGLRVTIGGYTQLCHSFDRHLLKNRREIADIKRKCRMKKNQLERKEAELNELEKSLSKGSPRKSDSKQIQEITAKFETKLSKAQEKISSLEQQLAKSKN